MRAASSGRLAACACAVVAIAAAIFGVGVAPEPPLMRPGAVVPLSAAARAMVARAHAPVARDAAPRQAKRLTLRVRNISCAGVATGSGFAIDRHTVISNRHVLAGAEELELNTWDGRSLTAKIRSAKTARLVDIGAAVVRRPLPEVARLGPPPKPGASVTAVGYPLGGPLTRSPGRVLGYRDGRTLSRGIAFDGRVMELSADVKHGNSGGPVLDDRGRVVGVIFAGEPGPTRTAPVRVAYAIPVDVMRSLIRRGGERPVIPCVR